MADGCFLICTWNIFQLQNLLLNVSKSVLIIHTNRGAVLKTTGSGCEPEQSSVWSLIVFPHKAGEKLRQRNFARWQLITQHLVLFFLLQTARGKAVHKVSHGFEDLGYFFTRIGYNSRLLLRWQHRRLSTLWNFQKSYRCYLNAL